MQVDVHTKKAPFRIFHDFADKDKVSMEHQDVQYLSVGANGELVFADGESTSRCFQEHSRSPCDLMVVN